MAKTKGRSPGKTPFRQAMNLIGQLIFERGMRGDLDMAVTSRRIGEATSITVLYPEGVMNFVVTDAELENELTPGQREVRRLRLGFKRGHLVSGATDGHAHRHAARRGNSSGLPR